MAEKTIKTTNTIVKIPARLMLEFKDVNLVREETERKLVLLADALSEAIKLYNEKYKKKFPDEYF